MKVKELIDRLQLYDGELDVIFYGIGKHLEVYNYLYMDHVIELEGSNARIEGGPTKFLELELILLSGGKP